MTTTFEGYLNAATQKLVQAGIETARLDVLVLLEDVLGTNRAQLLAHPERELDDSDVRILDTMIARRVSHEPLAYIRGTVEFYGREYIVTANVLVPRPESETMIDLLIDWLCHPKLDLGPSSKNYDGGIQTSLSLTQTNLDSSLRRNDKLTNGDSNSDMFDKYVKDPGANEKNILTSKVFSDLVVGDVGSGCGALGITAALELPGCQVELLEIDPNALLVSRRNMEKYSLKLAVRQSNLLANSRLQHDVLLCNLPYVPDDYAVNKAALREPALALYGGKDGLDLFRGLFEQIGGMGMKPWLILTESLPLQHSDLAAIASTVGYIPVAENDFIQAFTRT